ncbi:MAG: MFS transporter [Anaerolineae bacterium]|nr:MFS transporter [Anaerolineae bacterium]
MATQFSVDEGRRWKVPFFTIWTGQAVSLLGSQLVQFALIWHLTVETGSATVLATASLVGLLPQVILGPLTGTLVDRWNRRVIMIVADGMIALATVGLALVFAAGEVQLWHIYALMFLRSVGGGFHRPAMSASTSLMVPKEQLARLQGINQALEGGLNIFSAPLGALLLEILPLQGILAIDVVTAVIAITPLFFIAVPQPDRVTGIKDAEEKTSVWEETAAGVRYLTAWPGLLIVMLMASVVNLLVNPAFALIPLLVKDHFNGGAPDLASLEFLVGVGYILGGILLGVWGGFKRGVATSMLGIMGVGVGTLLMGQLPAGSFNLALAAVTLIGISLPVTNGPLMALVQKAVSPDMQGRVMTLLFSVSTAMTPIGLAVSGPLADRLGIQFWFTLGGISCVVMGLGFVLIPAVWNIEKDQSLQPSAGDGPEPVLAASND